MIIRPAFFIRQNLRDELRLWFPAPCWPGVVKEDTHHTGFHDLADVIPAILGGTGGGVVFRTRHIMAAL